MTEHMVRIRKITIENYKSVKKGIVSLGNNDNKYKSSVLGVYGKNGTGKTALIDAIHLLKDALCGTEIPNEYADCIRGDEKCATFKYELEVCHREEKYRVWYQFSLSKSSDMFALMTEAGENLSNMSKVILYNEVLSFSYESATEKLPIEMLMDTRLHDLFTPVAKRKELVGSDIEEYRKMVVEKRIRKASSSGFVFSTKMIDRYQNRCVNDIYLHLIERLYFFGNRELLVIDNDGISLSGLNVLPLVYKYNERVGSVMIWLNRPTLLSEEDAAFVENVLMNINIVLEELIPGLNIRLQYMGSAWMSDGTKARSVKLMSLRNGLTIPFACESDGVKKLVSFLQLLIVMYCLPSVTVAIDDIDGGIFENLLRKLLNIVSENGKGQLVFTSHSFRTLEMMDKGFVAFTTDNPQKRYVQLEGRKEHNDVDDSRVVFAFKKAGEML